MPYDFPRRYLRPLEVLNPDDLTGENTGAAELLSGQLDAHNFSMSPTIDSETYLANGALYNTRLSYRSGYIAQHATRDTDTTLLRSGQGNIGSEGNTKRLPITASWSTVLTRDFTVKQPTRLWITAFAQYFWWAWSSAARPGFPGHWFQYGDKGSSSPKAETGGIDHFPKKIYGASVQWAIKVNGLLIDESVTGSQDINQKSVIPLKLKVERLAGEDQFPGPSMQSTSQRASLGPAAWPSRFGCVANVQPGNVVVELVYRRLTDYRWNKKWGNRVSFNHIRSNAMSLSIIDMPWNPGSVPSSQSVSVPAFSDQETLSHDSMYATRLAPIVRSVGSIREGNVGRGAFRDDHLSSSVIKSDTVSLVAYRNHTGVTGFVYENKRPNEGKPVTVIHHPEAPLVTWYHKGERCGWCMWGVRGYGAGKLKDSGALGYHSTSAADLEANSTGNSDKPLPPPNGDNRYDVGTFGFAVLNGDWEFKEGRERSLLISADAGVLQVVGSSRVPLTDPTVTLHIEKYQRAFSNSGIFACFRIGFHVKGHPTDTWIMPSRSEAVVNQFCNWRTHQLFEGTEGSDRRRYGVQPMPTFANVSSFLHTKKPWYDAVGGGYTKDMMSLATAPILAGSTATSKDYTIDAIALFVSGFENNIKEGPHIGLSNVRLSAMLIDEGPDT